MEIASLKLHDHVCMIYESPKEQFGVIAPFIRIGLERNEKCIYIADDRTVDEVKSALKGERIDVEGAIERGAFAIVSKGEPCLQEEDLDPDRMIELAGREVEGAKREGYTGLRIAGEMTWALGGNPGPERLLEYESKLNLFLPEADCIAICQYNAKRFPAGTLLDMLRVHPIVIVKGKVCRNFYYQPPEEVIGPKSQEKALARCIANLLNRKELERELVASEERFRVLTERSLVGIYMSQKGKFIYVNPTLASIFGYTPEELVGKLGPFDLTHPEDRPLVAEQIRKRIEGRPEEMHYTFRGLRKDGKVIHCEVLGRRIIHRGRPAIIGTLLDITERVNAEKERMERESYYRELFENAPIGYHEIDRDGIITRVNRTEAELLGYSPEEMVGRPVFDFLSPDDREKSRQVVREKVERKRPLEPFERTYTHRNGTPINVKIVEQLIRDPDGNVVGIRSTLRDVTAERQVEDRIHQIARLEAIGRLAGGVAHDFNNVLTAIIGYSDLIFMKLKEGDPLRQHIEQIRKAADRASSLTRQLLAFSRRQPLEPRTVNLNEIISDLEDMLRRLIGENIELAIFPAPDLWNVRVDPTHMEEVIVNLVVNARDAMPAGGKLTIETANVVLDEDYVRGHVGVEPGPHAMLAITDTGCGMTEEVKSQIFEPFFSTKEGGTGLGLSVVYGIVKQSGGNIWVYSEPGKGTTFKIYLPRAEGEAERVKGVGTERLRCRVGTRPFWWSRMRAL